MPSLAVSRHTKARRVRELGAVRTRTIGATLTSRHSIDAEDQQIGAAVAAITQAIATCPAMTTADKTAWVGIAQSYATIHADLVTTEAIDDGGSFLNPGAKAYALTRYAILYDELEQLRPQIEAYRQRIGAVCGAGAVPPAPAVVAPPSGASSPWPKAITWVAAAAIVVGVAYATSPIVRAYVAGRRMARAA